MVRKWAKKPHKAEVICIYERNRFEPWASNCAHSLTGISQLLTVPKTNAEGMSQSAIFTIFITHASESPFYLILAFYNFFLVIQNVRRNHMSMAKMSVDISNIQQKHGGHLCLLSWWITFDHIDFQMSLTTEELRHQFYTQMN